MKLIALIHEDENGEYWAEVPALPGCISGGDTKLFFSVLAHNYFQLSSCDTEDRLKSSSNDTRLAELAI